MTTIIFLIACLVGILLVTYLAGLIFSEKPIQWNHHIISLLGIITMNFIFWSYFYYLNEL